MSELSKHVIKNVTLTFDHNAYNVNVITMNKKAKSIIVFPILHYQGDEQYAHLILPILEKGYKVITINLLNKGDRILFFNYYFDLFEDLFNQLLKEHVFKDEEISLMGVGIGAYLVSRMNFANIKFERIICISPLNSYKSDYTISGNIKDFTHPTYFFFGQNDSINSVDSRSQIYIRGKNNKNVHFSTYSINGFYCYYNYVTATSLVKMYKNSNINPLFGDERKFFLPGNPEMNERFFDHLFTYLQGKETPKRIGLMLDVFPLFVNGVGIVVELLQKELTKLGYETYIIALWPKEVDYSQLPNDSYIPVTASYVKWMKNHEQLKLIKSFTYIRNAKMLSTFGFSYLHLHTEYSMSGTALELSKITGIKLLYTYHTLWKRYYEHRYGRLLGDITYKAAKALLFKRIYKECSTITVPSKKSFEILQNETKNKDIRILPSPINMERFTFTKRDEKIVSVIKEQYKLSGKKVLGYVGRVSTEKNIIETIDYVSKIVKNIPNLVFMIVGTGDAETILHKYVKKKGLENNVIFAGFVPNNELKYYYRLFDAFVTASNFETQGLTHFEAAASNTLIIAKKDKAIENIFENNKNILIYDSYKEWVKCVEKSLFKDCSDIKKSAKEILKQYGQEKWAKKIVSIYKELNPNG